MNPVDDRITPNNVTNTTAPEQAQSPVTPPAPTPSVQVAPTQPSNETPVPPITQESQDLKQPEVIQNPAQPQAVPQPFTALDSENSKDAYYKEEIDKKRHHMKAVLEAQPKVQIMIPLAPGESADSWAYVAINGYPIHIKKNIMMEVPQQIAEMIRESYNMTSVVGKDYLIDAKRDRQSALK